VEPARDVIDYYDKFQEESRLAAGASRLEFERTKEILQRRLPKPPARIVDVGGAAGVYSTWLAGLGVVAIGADTIALEHIPFANENRPWIVHQTLLAKNGVHILENINTAPLAADGVGEFLFVLGAPRFVGTVQVVINPVAIR